MAVRIAKETLYLRREFTTEERLEMGKELAQAHNRLAAITDEDKVMKAQIKERTSKIEQTVGELSRKLNDGFDMENVHCSLKFDDPNVGEVTYYNPEGKAVKTRPMTEQERQLDLPLEEPATDKAVDESIAKSGAAVGEFFGTAENGEETEVEEPADLRLVGGPAKSGPKDLAAFHEAEVEKEATRGRKKKVVTEF